VKACNAASVVAGSAQEEPDRDLAGALHEVSNALTVVMGWLEAAQSRLPPGVAREALDIACEHAHLGYRVARQAIGAQVAREHDRTAVRLARDAVRSVRPEADRRGVRVSMQMQQDGDVVVHNPAAAQQIILNLLLNGIAFTPAGGNVMLTLRFDGDMPVFLVTDQGPGVPADRVDTIFTGPSSTRRGGAGIGLRYSSALACSNGAQLRLMPSAPGATFELRWPAGEARSGTYHSEAPVGCLAGRNVLVVEDDHAVVSLIELALEARGVNVTAVTSFAELTDVLGCGHRFDAALVDLSPISRNIEPALGAMRAGNSALPLILISGVASGVPDGVDGQFCDWVRKPFTMDEVVSALHRVFT
jgi:CheY-like chemotaxis protein